MSELCQRADLKWTERAAGEGKVIEGVNAKRAHEKGTRLKGEDLLDRVRRSARC